MQYLILSFGGQFYTADEQIPADTVLTHIVMDRPLPAQLRPKVEYVQPQYLADCANFLQLLPTAPYKPGVPPPAHLSPFVDGTKEGYMPTREREIRMMTGEEVVESEDDSGSDEDVENEQPKVKAVVVGKTDADSSVEESEDDEDEDAEQTKANLEKAKSERALANQKLKKDLEKEQKELAKTLMTNKQRKLYQTAKDEVKAKKNMARTLRAKRKQIQK